MKGINMSHGHRSGAWLERERPSTSEENEVLCTAFSDRDLAEVWRCSDHPSAVVLNQQYSSSFIGAELLVTKGKVGTAGLAAGASKLSFESVRH